MEENKEEERKPIDIELTEQNADPYNDKNASDFRRSDIQEDEEDIDLTNFIENYKSKLMTKIFQKSK